MAKENIAKLGQGGAGVVTGAERPGGVLAALQELQGLNFALLAGAGANTKINVAAIRTEDTVMTALNNNAGTFTDITGTITIDDLRAKGTVTAAAVTAGDTVTVDGKVYTAVANATVVEKHDYTKFKLGANNNETAANLAAAINKRMAATANPNVSAAAVNAVVTVTARAEGTSGNSITLASSNGVRLAVSGATLAGGSATGGIRSSGVTNSVWLFWYNKK